MDKKKAVICTVLLSIVVLGVFVATLLIKSDYGFNLYDIISPWICGAWMGEKIRTFYRWLTTK